WYPETFKEYREPFIGGGSIAFYTIQVYPDVPVWINDLYVPLYNFWIQLRDNGDELSERLKEIKTRVSDFATQDEKDASHRELFDKLRADINTQEGLERAVSFFILNKCSFSGLTENSTFSPTASRSNFSFVGIEKLKEYSKLMKNWKITNIDYSEVMNAPGEDVFVFLDPPYDIKDFLYGKDREMHKSFDHELFAQNVYKCSHKFMITYNVNERLLELYKDYYLREWKLRYSMAHRGERGTDENVKTELLITNYSTEKTNPLEIALYARD
ncbi:MAG: DNA adenine methylase, partial [Caulobacteraceae bacterium]|nr:DNA adenine methylase [Caulobacteraceae bacterium]